MERLLPSLDANWVLALSPAAAWAHPGDADPGPWHPALVPGTTAAALERVGLWNRHHPTPLHDKDVWYRTSVEGHGSAVLICEGLATVAEVWLDDALIGRSESMFAPLEIAVSLSGTHHLTIVFRSLSAHLATLKGPRARWRTRMVDEPRLRFLRTTFLGHAPGWCPPVHAVGLWRPVRLVGGAQPRLHQLRAEVSGRDGLLAVVVELAEPLEGHSGRTLSPSFRAERSEDPEPGSLGKDSSTPVPGSASPPRNEGNRVTSSLDDAPRLAAGDVEVPLTQDPDGLWRATLRIPDVALWWPNTHGTPHLYDVELRTASTSTTLARTGFRTLAVDRGPNGADFHVRINGTKVFCRGLCWTPDVVTLGSTRVELEPVLRTFAEAHVNMLRVGGTMVYESAAFHALCDELGILVWQDCMLANFDYPRDAAFAATVLAEVTALLRRTAGSPSLTVLCGGSEILQQAAMMGLPPDASAHPLFDTELPALLAAERPDVAYVLGSPSGGPLPFVADHGPSHYYGVGAYARPLADARRANVRFASECLAFSNVPEDATLAAFELDPVQDTVGWSAGVPQDNGADWTFEDTRHHYMALLHGIDPVALRTSDLQRYLDLSRATTAEVTERTFDEWRRPGSPAGGGLVWFGRDLAAGAGWGVVDVTGRPKSNFHAMRRAFAPLRIFITDEGVNGLVVHCVNDGDGAVVGRLAIECLRDGAVRVMHGGRDIEVPARGGVSVPAFTLFGSFFDAGNAYRFGAPPHDVAIATLDVEGRDRLDAFWHLDHARDLQHEAAPGISVVPDGDTWCMTLTSVRALRSLVIADRMLVPVDNWFHLAPNRSRTVRLVRLPGQASASPSGTVRALDLKQVVRYG